MSGQVQQQSASQPQQPKQSQQQSASHTPSGTPASAGERRLTPQEKELPPLSAGERFWYALLAMLARLPLGFWRGLGAALGSLLYWVIPRRRHVALVNLQLCFPEWSEAERKRVVLRHFIVFAQTFFDRIWLWHGSPELLRKRLRMVGDVQALEGDEPTILFAPHFVGLDAGGMALSGQLPQRDFISIYTPQRQAGVDTWVRRGRTRFANARVVWRRDGVKPIIAALRQRGMLYLLPDMNFGPQESIFVTFFGQPAATVPSLSRFARLGRAQVVTTITFLDPHGYTLHVEGPWKDFPTADVEADTQRMNSYLEAWVRQRPHEYFWVHKRFKTRPEGMPGVY